MKHKATTFAVASCFRYPCKSVAKASSVFLRPARHVHDPARHHPDVHRARRVHDRVRHPGTSTAPTTVSAMRPITMRTIAAARRWGAFAIEVRFIVRKIAAAFNHHRSGQAPAREPLPLRSRRRQLARRRRRPPIFARCSFKIALRDSRMRLPSTASTFTST